MQCRRSTALPNNLHLSRGSKNANSVGTTPCDFTYTPQSVAQCSSNCIDTGFMCRGCVLYQPFTSQESSSTFSRTIFSQHNSAETEMSLSSWRFSSLLTVPQSYFKEPRTWYSTPPGSCQSRQGLLVIQSSIAQRFSINFDHSSNSCIIEECHNMRSLTLLQKNEA